MLCKKVSFFNYETVILYILIWVWECLFNSFRQEGKWKTPGYRLLVQVSRHFACVVQGTKSSANRLWDQSWEFGRSMPGLVMKESENEVTQLCPTLCDPIDCSPPGSSIHGILQAKILEWVAISFSRGFSFSRDRTWVSFIAGRFFTIWATRPCRRPCLSVSPGEGSSLQWVMSRRAKGPGLLHGGTGLRKGQLVLSFCFQTRHPALSDGLCLMEGVETARTDDGETLSSGQTSKSGAHFREWRKITRKEQKHMIFF